MSYIGSDGRLQQSKPFGLNYIVDLFWAIVSFFILFFRGMFHMDEPSTKGQYGNSKAPAWPRRRMGRLGGGSSGPAPPPCMPGGG